MSGFAWLNELMVWLGRWVPRLLLVKQGHCGVKFGPGGSVVGLCPGLYVYWPITHEITDVSVRSRTYEIAAQLHGTEAIAVMVSYYVRDAVLALTQLHDIASNLDDRTQAALRRHHASGDDLIAEFSSAGIEITTVSIIQRGPVITLKNLNDWAHHSPREV